MVRDLKQEHENYKSRFYNFHKMQQQAAPAHHMESVSVDRLAFQANESSTYEYAGQRSNDKGLKPPVHLEEPKPNQPSDLDLMKERFAKLLLGEDMSGGGRGVSSALALSNAITNLAASVFGDLKRLEPVSPERKARWKKEIKWLLSVTDHIVEFVPSQQKVNGVNMEVMMLKQRTDLQLNIPALRKMDAILIECLDNFKDQTEFYYVKRGEDNSEKGNYYRKDDKWWLPTCKVPPEGLSELIRTWLEYQKDSVDQVHKAAMAINAQVLLEMEIPENYIESLPKNRRAILGDSIYKSITVEYFDPDEFLLTVDLSNEHKILDLKNRIEASTVIRRRKTSSTKDSNSHWGSPMSPARKELFEERAKSVLIILKQRFPGISQSTLDISKIQYNRDVGHAILESYSRVIESLASMVLSRIDDVLYADLVTRNKLQASFRRNSLLRTPSTCLDQLPDFKEEIEKLGVAETSTSMTALDFVGWNATDQGDAKEKRKDFFTGDELHRDSNKHPASVANKRTSYLERIEIFSRLRSPSSRHW